MFKNRKKNSESTQKENILFPPSLFHVLVDLIAVQIVVLHIERTVYNNNSNNVDRNKAKLSRENLVSSSRLRCTRSALQVSVPSRCWNSANPCVLFAQSIAPWPYFGYIIVYFPTENSALFYFFFQLILISTPHSLDYLFVSRRVVPDAWSFLPSCRKSTYFNITPHSEELLISLWGNESKNSLILSSEAHRRWFCILILWKTTWHCWASMKKKNAHQIFWSYY